MLIQHIVYSIVPEVRGRLPVIIVYSIYDIIKLAATHTLVS